MTKEQKSLGEFRSDADRVTEYHEAGESDEALLTDELVHYGLPANAGLWALLRHIYNNRDAALGAYRLATDGWEARALAAERELEELRRA